MEETGPQQIDSNSQCGECGKIFGEESEVNDHMDNNHKEVPAPVGKVVFLTPENCKECTVKDKKLSEAEARETIVSSNDKGHDLLKRRHDALKEKYEEVIKKNKEYAKNVFNAIKENTELRTNAEKDAEILADTLSINQVLVEEIKVKDEIIKADELLNQNKNEECVIIDQDDDDNVDTSNGGKKMVSCKQCDWTSPIISQIEGHMLKHNGQYTCGICKKTFKNKNEWKKHSQDNHKSEGNEAQASFTCITCDKTFQSKHSLN